MASPGQSVGLMAFGSLLALAAVRSTGSNLLGGQSLAVQGPDRDQRVRSFDRLTPRRLIVPIRRQSQGTARPIRSRSSVRRQPASVVLGPGYGMAICTAYLRTLSAFRECPVDGVEEISVREMQVPLVVAMLEWPISHRPTAVSATGASPAARQTGHGRPRRCLGGPNG